MLRYLFLGFAIIVLWAGPVFAVGPIVSVVGFYCIDKNSEPDLAGYRFLVGQTNDLSDAVVSDFPIIQMSADDQGDKTRTCAVRDQSGLSKGTHQFYASATAYDLSGNNSLRGPVVPYEVLVIDGTPPNVPSNLNVR